MNSACLMCGDVSDWPEQYSALVAGVDLCNACCEKVARAHYMKHGQILVDTREKPAYVKKSIPRWLAKRVFERDQYRCVTCNDYIDLCCDHIIPESLGGETVESNLQTMCRPCNSRKGAVSV